jgi:hypothetical protein
MHHLTNLELAIQHRHALRADAARARVAAAPRQARSRQFRFECVRRIGRSALGRRPLADRRRRAGVASTAPVRVVSSARSQPFGDLVAAVAEETASGLASSTALTSGDRSLAAERHAEPSLLPPSMSSAAGRRHRRVERAEWRSIGDAILDHTGRS